MRLVDADDIMEDISDLMQSPWFKDDTDHAQYLARKEAVEIVRDLCVKNAPTVYAERHTYTINLQGDQSSSFECFACRWKSLDMPDNIQYRYCPMCRSKILRIASEDEIFRGAKRVEIPSVKKREKMDGGDDK